MDPTLLLLLLFAAAPEPPSVQPPAGPAAIEVLQEVWSVGAESIFPRSLATRFDDSTLDQLSTQLRNHPTLPLAEVLNPFLFSLGVSHTQFFDVRHHGYYMLRSLFTTRDLDSPELYVLGLQMEKARPDRVRAVLDGLPADQAGVQVGDILVSVDGQPYASLQQWQHPQPVTLTVRSGGATRESLVQPRRMGMHRALLEATGNSAQEWVCDHRRVGYLHLWSGTHEAFLETLNTAAVSAVEKQLGAFILDLRDGYGGAWWPYLDGFFADRQSYFQAIASGPDGASDPLLAQPQINAAHFDGELVVLINGGTRSGKESLAWQFKRSGRARLFGTTTEGAFTAGRGIFADRDAPYMLYLSVAEYQLDGVKIEGVGVAPHVQVERPGSEDKPLKAAMKHLGCGDQS